MGKTLKNEKAITLIALIITIIVLLILAGVSIATLSGDNGILNQATTSKEETIKAQLKEEIELAIAAIKAEELPKGNPVTLESLAGKEEGEEGQLEKAEELQKGTITAKLGEPGIVGEYKGYNYTIDGNFKVTIEGTITGISINYSLSTEDGILETDKYTNKDVTLTINASSTNGNIVSITGLEGLEKNEDGTYTIKITRNGTYTVIVTDSAGTEKTKKITIDNIDRDNPEISGLTISNQTTTGFTIEVVATDKEETEESAKSGIEKYEYKINGSTKDTINKNSYTVKGLESATNYNVEVIVYDGAGNTNSGTITAATLRKPIVSDLSLVGGTGSQSISMEEGQEYTLSGEQEILSNETISAPNTFTLSIEVKNMKPYYNGENPVCAPIVAVGYPGAGLGFHTCGIFLGTLRTGCVFQWLWGFIS